MLLLPLPLGPMMAVIPGSKLTSTFLAKDLKPNISSFSRRKQINSITVTRSNYTRKIEFRQQKKAPALQTLEKILFYLPTRPIRLIIVSSISSTAVTARAAALYAC